jgi:hypothetical protein
MATDAISLLALQRSAGNRAVGRLLRSRPARATLARAAEPDNVTDQNEVDVAGVLQTIAEGEALVVEAMEAFLEAQLSAGTAGGALPPPPAGSRPMPVQQPGGPVRNQWRTRDEPFRKLQQKRRLARKTENLPLNGFLSEDPTLNQGLFSWRAPTDPPGPSVTKASNWRNPRQATDLQAQITDPYGLGVGPNAPVDPAPPAPQAPPGRGTGTLAKTKRRTRQPGTGTQTRYRPPDWATFRLLVGFLGRERCDYIQGHLLNEHLGGLGTNLQNLAPFTSSLNGRHSKRVEEPIKQFLEPTHGQPPIPPNEERVVDYRVEPIYGNPNNPTAVITQASTRMDDLFRNRGTPALSALAKLRLVDPLEVFKAANSMTQLPPQQAPLPLTLARWQAVWQNNNNSWYGTGPQQVIGNFTWSTLNQLLHTWIVNYVTLRFPEQIRCRVRYYRRLNQAPNWDRIVDSQNQGITWDVVLTNDFAP